MWLCSSTIARTTSRARGNLSRSCNNLFPRLLLDYRTLNENSDRQKMEIIYVPLDDTEEEYIKMRARMPWLALPYNRETVNGEPCLSP